MLDGAHLDEYVHRAGVAIVEWRDPRDAVSLLFEQVLERVSRAHGDVRFGAVDVSRDRALDREWQVEQVSTVMAYRDGILVFSRPGPLPEQVVNSLIDVIWSLDMEEVRRGVDGHGTRTVIALSGDREPAFEIADGQGPSGKGGSGSSPGTGH